MNARNQSTTVHQLPAEYLFLPRGPVSALAYRCGVPFCLNLRSLCTRSASTVASHAFQLRIAQPCPFFWSIEPIFAFDLATCTAPFAHLLAWSRTAQIDQPDPLAKSYRTRQNSTMMCRELIRDLDPAIDRHYFISAHTSSTARAMNATPPCRRTVSRNAAWSSVSRPVLDLHSIARKRPSVICPMMSESPTNPART